jgi:DNA mismatch endonuclease (patch repair protein)
VFVHGCFWHGHDCPMCRLPATRPEFWRTKIAGNRDRDRKTEGNLRSAGWRVLVVWECALRGPARLPDGAVIARAATFLWDLPNTDDVIEGKWPRCGERHAG